jgi:hypothetical protein
MEYQEHGPEYTLYTIDPVLLSIATHQVPEELL